MFVGKEIFVWVGSDNLAFLVLCRVACLCGVGS